MKNEMQAIQRVCAKDQIPVTQMSEGTKPPGGVETGISNTVETRPIPDTDFEKNIRHLDRVHIIGRPLVSSPVAHLSHALEGQHVVLGRGRIVLGHAGRDRLGLALNKCMNVPVEKL
jgi:hypothetical protein